MLDVNNPNNIPLLNPSGLDGDPMESPSLYTRNIDQGLHAHANGASSKESDEKKSYSPFTAYCFTVNYILGVGVLGMPYAFSQAGYMLSSICLFLVTLAAIASAQWITDVVARAQIISSKRLNKKENIQAIFDRRFDMNQLCDLFLGSKYSRFYEVCVAIYLIGSLWSYASVFASSFASHVPLPFANNGNECDDSSTECYYLYLYYLLIFSFFAIPVTCLDLTEMKILQIALALFRFVSLITMMITSLVSLYSFPYLPDDSSNIHNVTSSLIHSATLSNSTSGSSPYFSDIKPFVWSGLSIVFPTSIFAQIFHHSVPILSHPVSPSNKKTLPGVYTAVLITTFMLYCALGITVGLYYGSSTHQVCTLNWADYTGSSNKHYTPGWASFISYMVVLFPPIDIISAFPLNAITLGTSLLTSFVHDPEKLRQRKYIIPFRLIAAIIPIVGACIVKDLSSILQYTGCVGVIIAFIYPCLLQYFSIQLWKQEFSDDKKNLLDYEPSEHIIAYQSEGALASGPGLGLGQGLAEEIGSLADQVSLIQNEHEPCVYTNNDFNRKQLIPSHWFSFSPRWLSSSMAILGSVFSFSMIGLIAVIILSIVTA